MFENNVHIHVHYLALRAGTDSPLTSMFFFINIHFLSIWSFAEVFPFGLDQLNDSVSIFPFKHLDEQI